LPSTLIGSTRFRNRRDAEKALAEIVEDGGRPSEYKIDEGMDGTCVIVILDNDGNIAGTLGV